MTDKREIKQQKSNRRREQKPTEANSQRDEFRHRKGAQAAGHVEYIYRKKGNTYEFIGITHSPITRRIKNIKLDKNPNPHDTTETYIKPMPERDSVNNFQRQVIPDWKLADSDRPKIEAVKKKGVKDKKNEK